VSFRRRNYPEVLDNLLTSLVGGVAAEAHPFPPGDGSTHSHQLEQPPVKQVVSVYGRRNGEPYLFRAGTNYQLQPDKQTLSWLSDTQVPDPGTLVYVNYLREDDASSLTDLQVGSVVRTITESIALEIARLYAQLEAVYQAGFIDTASGSALDKVVALLDVQRIKGTRPSVKVQFKRARGARGTISLPAGTRILDQQVKFEYETTETVTMAEQQNSVTVAARDLEPGNEPVAADTLTILAVPIAGISGVTNPAPASRANADETDAELRTRAKNFLHGSERATLGALKQVLAKQQVAGDVEETAPGVVTVTPHGDDLTPERLLQLDTELQASRPAGVEVLLAAPLAPLAVDLSARLTTAEKTLEADLRAAHAQVRDAIRGYFDSLETRADASINQIVGRVLAVPNLLDVQIDKATTREIVDGVPLVTDRLDRAAGIIDLAGQPTVLGELTLADSNLPTELDLVINFPAEAAIPAQADIEAALGQTLAYLNQLAAEEFDPADTAAVAKRQLSLGKFLWILPLPGNSGQSLETYDAAADPSLLPAAADRAPYLVSVYLSQASGLTSMLADDSAGYTLSRSERLLLHSLSIAVEAS
jgi:hypothetical protein